MKKKETMKRIKKNKTWAVLLLLSCLATFLCEGYIFWQTKNLKTQIKTLKKEEINLDNSIRALSKSGSLSDQKKLLSLVDRIHEYRIPWSKIVSDVMRLESDKIAISGFTSSRDRVIFAEGSASSLAAVASYIDRLETHPKLGSVFVRSTSKTASHSQGPLPYSFQFSFLYTDS